MSACTVALAYPKILYDIVTRATLSGLSAKDQHTTSTVVLSDVETAGRRVEMETKRSFQAGAASYHVADVVQALVVQLHCVAVEFSNQDVSMTIHGQVRRTEGSRSRR